MSKFPVLYHKSKNGELRSWQVWTEGADIVTEHGIVGGALQQSRKRATAKNMGRSNATTPEEQAGLEARSLWKFKLDRKYFLTPEETKETLLLPMLAHAYKGTKKKNFNFPAHLQPKLDGLRVIAYRQNDQIILSSRNGKPYFIPHITEQLSWLPDGVTLDGEIYKHDVPFQTLNSWVKSACPQQSKSYKPESQQLEYHVYDVPVFQHNTTALWQERSNWLIRNVQTSQNIKIVPHEDVFSDKDVKHFFAKFIRQGYEGAILRGFDGQYLWGYRSSKLLKIKEFEDAEFLIVGYKSGIGKMKNCVIWICQNDLTMVQFDCVPRGTMEERAEWYKHGQDFVGKRLTVRFQGRTIEGSPRFPVGIKLRLSEDLA